MYGTPVVSIITPYYMCKNYIKETIDSVLNQSFEKWEMIIIEDGYSDEGLADLPADPRIKVIRLEKSLGASGARNAGIRAATGRYIAYLDSDDVWHKDKLEKQLKFMEEKNCALSYTGYVHMDECSRRKNTGVYVPEYIDFKTMRLVNWCGFLTVVYDTEKLGKIYMDEHKRSNDYAFLLKLLKLGIKGYGLNEILASYRIRAGSLSSSKIDQFKHNYNILRQYYNPISSLAYSLINPLITLSYKRRKIKSENKKLGTILMLHRIAERGNGVKGNESLKISPEFLEGSILELKDRGYTFVSMDELYDILKEGRPAEKLIHFTLDDGYKDNYTAAYPIFKKYSIPFTLYITTDFPDKRAKLWWYSLEEYVSGNEKEFWRVRKEILKKGWKFLLGEIPDYSHLTLDWDEIIEMSRDSLVTIGAHTVTHRALTALSEEEIIKEVMESKKIIEEKIKKPVEHFSYPFGSRREAGRREFKILRKLGFKTCTTTRSGNIFMKHRDEMERLPRVFFTEERGLSKL